MKTSSMVAVLTGIGAAAAIGRQVAAKRKAAGRDEHSLAVTVRCSPERVRELPEPLARLRDEAEFTVRPAPGDKGMELLARPTGDVSREDLRVALREAKSLIETGTVLPPDTPGSTHPGLPGRLVRMLTNRAAREGRL